MLVFSIMSPIFIMSDPVQAAFSGGDGSSGDPYQIATESDINDLRQNGDGNYFIVTADITCTAPLWSSGVYELKNSVFDGQNYTISGARMGYSAQASFFGDVDNVTIKNIKFEDLLVPYSDSSGRSGLIAEVVDGGPCLFENIHIYNSTLVAEAGENGEVGGLVGKMSSGANTINLCSIENSYIYNNDSTSDATGGLVGGCSGTVYINNSFFNGTVRGGGNDVGGIVGGFWGGSINNCYSICTVYSNLTSEDAIGGFIGYGSDAINNCYSVAIVKNATGVEGSSNFGPFCGEDDGLSVTNCFYDSEYTNCATETSDATGKTTTQMKTLATFTDTATAGLTTAWDFVGTPNDDSGSDDFWNISEDINDGYPYLVGNEPLPAEGPATWEDANWTAGWTIATDHSCTPLPYLYGNWSELEFFDGGTADDLWTEANDSHWTITDHSAWWAGNYTYEINTTNINCSFAVLNSSGTNRSQVFGWVHTDDTQVDALYPFIIFAYNNSQDFDCVMWSSTEAWVLNWNGTNMTDIATGSAVVDPSTDAEDLSNQWVQEGVYLTDGGNYYKLIYNEHNGSLRFKWWGGASFLTEPVGWCIETQHLNLTHDTARCHGIGMWNPNDRKTYMEYDMINVWSLNYSVNTSDYCNISSYNESRPHMDFPVIDLGTWTEEIMSYFNASAEGNVSLATVAKIMKDNITNPMNMESRGLDLATLDNGQQNDTIYYYSCFLDNFTAFSAESYDEWLHLHVQMCPEDDIETSEYGDFLIGIDVDNNRVWDANDRIYWAYADDGGLEWNQTYNGNGDTVTNIASWNIWESEAASSGNLHRYNSHLNYAINIPLADLVKTGGEPLNSSDLFGLSILTTTSGTALTSDAAIWQNWNETSESSFYTEENNLDNVMGYFFGYEGEVEAPTANATILARWGEGEIGTGVESSGDIYYSVTIEKTANITTVAAESTFALVNYSIWVNNTGAGPLTNVVVNDTKFNCSCHDFNESGDITTNISWDSVTNQSCHRLFNTTTIAAGSSWHIWYTVNITNCSGTPYGNVTNTAVVNATQLTSSSSDSYTISWGNYASRVCVVYTTPTTDVGDIGSNVFNILGIVFIVGAIMLFLVILQRYKLF